MMRDALVEHMNKNNLFSKEQHGFVKEILFIQLLEFMEDIIAAIEQGNDVDVLYFDFIKAFDKIPQRKLLEKLWGYDIWGNIHEDVLLSMVLAPDGEI